MLSTMAIEVCAEISSPGISPRISFSHDLDKANAALPKEEQRQQQQQLDSSQVDSGGSDFDFCIVNNVKLELSSADELFSDGKILPAQIKPKPNTIATKDTIVHLPRQSATKNTNKKRLKEFLDDSNAEDEPTQSEEKPPTAKSSWQFRRSSSLNLESTTARGINLIRSLHFLSRSNSTGSTPNPPKQTATLNQKHQHLCKNQSTNSRRRSSSSSCSSSTTYYPYNTSPRSHKPSLRRTGSYGNGVRINPVLNLPPPYISKVTANFFGFGSLFCNGKLKKKKK